MPDDDRPRGAEASRDRAVLGGDPVEPLGPDRRAQTGDVVAVLERQRHAVKRTDSVTARERSVGGRGLPARGFDIERHDRIERGVAALDTAEMRVERLDRRSLAIGNVLCQGARRHRAQVVCCWIHGPTIDQGTSEIARAPRR